MIFKARYVHKILQARDIIKAYNFVINPNGEDNTDPIYLSRQPHTSRNTGSPSTQRGNMRAGCAAVPTARAMRLSRRVRLGRKPANQGSVPRLG